MLLHLSHAPSLGTSRGGGRGHSQTAAYAYKPGLLSSGAATSEFCSAFPSSAAASSTHHQQRCNANLARTNAVTSTRTVSVMEESKWWERDSDLWQEVHTEDEYKAAVSTGDKLVIVDFYATWCHGCQKSFPEVCKVLRGDPRLTSKVKLVKVCVDGLKALARKEGVAALPAMSLYHPSRGKLLLLDIPFSKVKNLKTNVEYVLARMDAGAAFAQDPNGFIVTVGSDTPPEQAEREAAAAAKKAAAAALESGGLFQHLMRVAGSGQTPPSAHTPPSPQPPLSSSHSAPPSSTEAAAAAATARDGGVGGAAGVAAVRQRAREAAEGRLTGARVQPPAGVDPVTWARDRDAFLARWGREYGYGGLLEDAYEAEIGARLPPGHHYLDYTATAPYTSSHLAAVFTDLGAHLYGNPHSANPSSALTSDILDEARAQVLRWFNADPHQYQVVFTQSATGALKMVGETFPWTQGSVFRYLRENHNSVLGVREYAIQHGATFQALGETGVEAWLRGQRSMQHDPPAADGASGPTYSLFAFPAEDNFAGVKYPLDWARHAHARSTDQHQWLVLVDAASYVPTQPLDLGATPADFVSLSFYKMFGYPTGLGALIVRTPVVPLLRKVFWGGGTVALATSEDNFHVLKCNPSDKMEDGTVAFLDIIALRHGFAAMERLGGMRKIQAHVASLTEWTYARMSALRHANGAPVVALFGRHGQPNARTVQGGILNFEVLRPDGSIVSYKQVEREAAAAGLHLRTGAECNPGAAYNYLGVSEREVEGLAGIKEGCEDDIEFIEVERQRLSSSPQSELHAADLLRCIRSPSSPAMVAGPTAQSAPVPNTSNTSVAASSDWGALPLLQQASALQPSSSTQTVQAALGSVRASLGYWSTFSDVYALVHFIDTHYRT